MAVHILQEQRLSRDSIRISKIRARLPCQKCVQIGCVLRERCLHQQAAGPGAEYSDCPVADGIRHDSVTTQFGQRVIQRDIVDERLIEVGEASGGLDSMLAEVAQFYEEMLDIRLARVMALVEPLLMLLMGVLVGGIIIVMYMPVFHMADVLK